LRKEGRYLLKPPSLGVNLFRKSFICSRFCSDIQILNGLGLFCLWRRLRKGTSRDGELGLGSRKYEGKKPMDVERPRINHSLSAKPIDFVALAVGGRYDILG
jgi:hypothetical protein